MDLVAKTEVLLNILNTAIAYASFFNSPQLSILQDMQYQVYHTTIPLSEIDIMIETILAIKKDIVVSNFLYEKQF